MGVVGAVLTCIACVACKRDRHTLVIAIIIEILPLRKNVESLFSKQK